MVIASPHKQPDIPLAFRDPHSYSVAKHCLVAPLRHTILLGHVRHIEVTLDDVLGTLVVECVHHELAIAISAEHTHLRPASALAHAWSWMITVAT